jgi:hypothetical protein
MPRYLYTTGQPTAPPAPRAELPAAVIAANAVRAMVDRPVVLVAEIASVTNRDEAGVLADLHALDVSTWSDWAGRPVVFVHEARQYADAHAAGTLDSEVKAARQKAAQKAKDDAARAEHMAACEEWTARRTGVALDAADEAERKLAQAGHPIREGRALGDPPGTVPDYTEPCKEARKAAAIAAGAAFERKNPPPERNGRPGVPLYYVPLDEGDTITARLARTDPEAAIELATA